jgi:hypothetical protein
MKTKLKPFTLIAAAILLLVSSCILDEDVDPNPTDPIEKFLGTWSASDNELKLNYEVQISRDPNNSTMVLISNFADSGSAAKALAVGGSLVIESQTIGNNWLVSGTGTYRNTGRIDFPYSLTIGGSQEGRSAIFTR